MTAFSYKAVSSAGEVTIGQLDAESRQHAIARLQSLGQTPIRVDERRDRSTGRPVASAARTSSGRSAKIAASIVRQMETLLRAGVTVDQALEILHGQAISSGEAKSLRLLLQKVRSGRSLADAVAEDPLFPRYCIGVVRAGEVGGVLETTLGSLADQMERSLQAREKLQSAMLYPLIVAGACMLSFVFLFSFVIPRFQAFFENSSAPIPTVTAAVLWIGNVVDQHGAAIAVGVGFAALVVMQLFRTPRFRSVFSRRILQIPLLGQLLAKAEVGQFCRVLGTLLKNGVPLSSALDVANGTFRNPVFSAAVAEAAARVREGRGLAESLRPSGVFPRLALRLISVGEEAARMDDMLLETAEVLDREADRDIQRMIAVLGPTLTIGLGLAVALIVGSILVALLGVYQLTGL